MLFCVSYQSSHKQEADEIKCPWNQLGLIWGMIKDNPEKRYIISLDEVTDHAIKEIDLVKETGCDYSVACGNLSSLHTMLNKGYKAYWDVPICDWDTFNSLKELRVTDIWVDGSICFDGTNLSLVREEVKLRVSPSYSPNIIVFGAAANSFFIRPEDTKFYEDIFTTYDFNAPTQDAEDALFNIYKRGYFDAYIDSLIPSLPHHIINTLIADEFAISRLDCRQLCKIPNRHCGYCKHYLDFVATATDYFQSTETT